MFCIFHAVVLKRIFWLQTQHQPFPTAPPHPGISLLKAPATLSSTVPPLLFAQMLGCASFFLSGAGGKWFKEASGKTSPGFAQSMGLGERAAVPWAHRRYAPLPTRLETLGAFEPPLSSLHNHHLSSSSSWTQMKRSRT